MRPTNLNQPFPNLWMVFAPKRHLFPLLQSQLWFKVLLTTADTHNAPIQPLKFYLGGMYLLPVIGPFNTFLHILMANFAFQPKSCLFYPLSSAGWDQDALSMFTLIRLSKI